MNLNGRGASNFQSLLASFRTAVFFFKVLPMLPSRPVNWVTPHPVREHVAFATDFGHGDGDVYRPSDTRTHPGIVVSLGVIPEGFNHPQVPRLGEALARAGFAALLYRSPAMDDLRLVPEDVGNVAAAYHFLTEQSYVRGKGGLMGTCVGGSFALMAAAHPAVRERVDFVVAFAPYASMPDLALQIASSATLYGDQPEAWDVDQLTRKVFVHSATSMLSPDEAARLRETFEAHPGPNTLSGLSPEGQLVAALVSASDPDLARKAFDRLPDALRTRMEAISPANVLEDIRAPVIAIGHDRDDHVVPVGESRRIQAALAARPGFRYTEFGLFQHADPTKRNLALPRLAWELEKFFRYVYPVFREAAR